MVSWYIKGGFKDELGVWHPSGHVYNFEYWEPMNEEDQRFSPEELTKLYDASVSYHFYTGSESDETPEIMKRTMFRQADQILTTVGYIEAFRERFLPQAKTDITELGSILMPAEAVDPHPSIPASYWSLSGSVWPTYMATWLPKGLISSPPLS